MIGILVLILLLVWIFVAIWLGKWLSRTVFARFTAKDESGVKSGLITFFLIAVVFLLPVLDQIIAYPKWQQLCSTTGDFEWGPGMDGKKAFGRELLVSLQTEDITVFPSIHATYYRELFVDKTTNELVLVMPHSSYNSAKGVFYLPSSSGSKKAMFLPDCTNSSNSKQATKYLNQFDLKVVGYN